MRELGIFSQGRRRLWGDITAAFQCLKGCYVKGGKRLSTRACDGWARGNGYELKQGRFGVNIKNKFFTMRVVRHWSRLPRKVMDTTPLKLFSAGLAGALSSLR